MKQNLLKSLFSIVLLMLGVNALAGTATGTLTFGTSNVKINAASVTGNDSQSNTWTIATEGTTSFTPNSAYCQVGSSKAPATSITFTTTLSEEQTFTAFSAKFGGFSGTTGTVTLKIDDSTVGTGSLNESNDVTINATGAKGKTLTVTVTGIAKGVKCYNISYSYTSSAPDNASAPELSESATFTTTPYEVTITNKESGSVVYYTTDGNDPTTLSDCFVGASKTISISETTTVKAMSVISGKGNSSITSAKYTYSSHKTPTFTYGTCKKTMFTDDAADSYELTYDGDGALSVTSSETSVATVSISGNTVTVTPVAAGKTTITMSAAQTDNYYKTSRTYTLTVKGIAELPFTFDGQKGDITDLAGIDYASLGSNYDSSPKLKFDTQGGSVIVNYNSTAKYLYYTVKGNGFSDGQFDVLQSEDGVTYSTVKSYTAIDGTLAEYYSLNSSSRFVKFVYTTKSAGNVALGAIEISNNEPQTTVSVGSTGYATYYNSKHAYVMPEGCEGWVAYWNSKFVFEKAYSEGDIVPAGVALVLKNEGDYTLKYTNEAGTKPSKNYLSGTDEETELAANEKCYFYALSLDKEGNNVGFYWMNATGAAFTNGANKAYLTINKSNFPTKAKSGFAFNDATAINNVNAEVDSANSLIYNLAGQRVNSNAKGIVIKNGRKYINK